MEAFDLYELLDPLEPFDPCVLSSPSGRWNVTEHHGHFVRFAIVVKGNSTRVDRNAVEMRRADATASVLGVRDRDPIDCSAEPPGRRALRPHGRHAWVHAERRALPLQPDESFDRRLIHPAG